MPSRRAVDVTPFANFLAVQGDGHRLINGVDSVKIGDLGSRFKREV